MLLSIHTVEDPERRKAVGTFKLLQQLVAEEGIDVLYAGIAPVLQSLCISNFVYFYTFHGLKALCGRSEARGPLLNLGIGMVAGVINVLATTPIWVVNTRLRSKALAVDAAGRRNPYSNLLEGLFYIYKTEGIYGLWSGTIPSLMLVSNPALQFMMYESLKQRFVDIHRDAPALKHFVIGALAKAFATVMTYPLQLIQTKLRAGQKGNEMITPLTMLLSIVKRYGAAGLFRGLEAKLLQTVLTAALMFMTYEKIAKTVTSLMISGKPKQ